MKRQRTKRGGIEDKDTSLPTPTTLICVFVALAPNAVGESNYENQRTPTGYQCVYCDTLFELKTDLNAHYRARHKNALKDFRNYLTNRPAAT